MEGSRFQSGNRSLAGSRAVAVSSTVPAVILQPFPFHNVFWKVKGFRQFFWGPAIFLVMILVLISSLRSILAIPWLNFAVFQKKIGKRSICENEFLLLFGQTGEKRKLILLYFVCIYVCLKMDRLHVMNIKIPLVFPVRLKSPFPQRKDSHWVVYNVRVMFFYYSNSGLRKVDRHSVSKLSFFFFQTEK